MENYDNSMEKLVNARAKLVLEDIQYVKLIVPVYEKQISTAIEVQENYLKQVVDLTSKRTKRKLTKKLLSDVDGVIDAFQPLIDAAKESNTKESLKKYNIISKNPNSTKDDIEKAHMEMFEIFISNLNS